MTKKICPLPLGEVDVDDEFWKPRLQTNRIVTLEHQYNELNASGCLDNFRRVIGEAGGSFEGPMFIDANVYKWLESASYTLATSSLPTLADRVSEIVSLIERAQAEDGYLHTYIMLEEPDMRWTNLSTMHELYCAGQLIEAAVAHYRATDAETLLAVARRFADHVEDRFGTEDNDGIPGHEEIELALVRLYHVTEESRYLELAETFIERRGRTPSPLARELSDTDASFGGAEFTHHNRDLVALARFHFLDEYGEYDGRYAQDHLPVRSQRTIEGHAVRATYLYTGVAELLKEREDPELLAALKRLWTNMTSKRMYITGALGSEQHHEGFSGDYNLPNTTACGETCATIGCMLWSQRMFELSGSSKYIDVLETALYNAFLAGISMNGKEYFYLNPLETSGDHERQEWFYVACCPPNASRFLASVPKYIYCKSATDDTLYVNLFVSSQMSTIVNKKEIQITQQTAYPWEGEVTFEISVTEPIHCDLKIRTPSWAEEVTIEINGNVVSSDSGGRYVSLDRTWETGDEVRLSAPMTVKLIKAHPEIRRNLGRVAIQRGPLVYCLEEVDNPSSVRTLNLGSADSFEDIFRPDLLGGVTIIRGNASSTSQQNWNGSLYTSESELDKEPTDFFAVPYYSWGDRGPGEMAVWVSN